VSISIDQHSDKSAQRQISTAASRQSYTLSLTHLVSSLLHSGYWHSPNAYTPAPGLRPVPIRKYGSCAIRQMH
jgi:hypothetical protein